MVKCHTCASFFICKKVCISAVMIITGGIMAQKYWYLSCHRNTGIYLWEPSVRWLIIYNITQWHCSESLDVLTFCTNHSGAVQIASVMNGERATKRGGAPRGNARFDWSPQAEPVSEHPLIGCVSRWARPVLCRDAVIHTRWSRAATVTVEKRNYHRPLRSVIWTPECLEKRRHSSRRNEERERQVKFTLKTRIWLFLLGHFTVSQLEWSSSSSSSSSGASVASPRAGLHAAGREPPPLSPPCVCPSSPPPAARWSSPSPGERLWRDWGHMSPRNSDCKLTGSSSCTETGELCYFTHVFISWDSNTSSISSP